MKKYLHENPNPVDLDFYISQMEKLTAQGVQAWTQLSIYKKLFTVKSYRNNPEVRPITSDKLIESRASLAIDRITWQYFKESDVLQNVLRVFNAPEYSNARAAFQARVLYDNA